MPSNELVLAFLALGSSAFTLLKTFDEITRQKKELSGDSDKSILSEPESTCKLCDGAVTALLVLYNDKKFPEQTIKDISTKICAMMQLQTEDVCRGLVDINLVSKEDKK